MSRQIVTAGLQLRVTLEVSATGSGDAARTIPLDYPIATIVGVWAAASEGGTNLYDASCSHDGSTILMGDGTVSASTTYYVSYYIEAHLPAIGYAATGHQGSVLAVAPAMPLKIVNSQAVSYEIVSPTAGATVNILASSIKCTITHIKVLTDGTNIGLYLYSGDTATRANMEFQKTAINTLWFSTDSYSDLKIAFDSGSIYLGIVDTGANATPANTYVTLRGHVGV
jgi:hypothetical protein